MGIDFIVGTANILVFVFGRSPKSGRAAATALRNGVDRRRVNHAIERAQRRQIGVDGGLGIEVVDKTDAHDADQVVVIHTGWPAHLVESGLNDEYRVDDDGECQRALQRDQNRASLVPQQGAEDGAKLHD